MLSPPPDEPCLAFSRRRRVCSRRRILARYCARSTNDIPSVSVSFCWSIAIAADRGFSSFSPFGASCSDGSSLNFLCVFGFFSIFHRLLSLSTALSAPEIFSLSSDSLSGGVSAASCAISSASGAFSAGVSASGGTAACCGCSPGGAFSAAASPCGCSADCVSASPGGGDASSDSAGVSASALSGSAFSSGGVSCFGASAAAFSGGVFSSATLSCGVSIVFDCSAEGSLSGVSGSGCTSGGLLDAASSGSAVSEGSSACVSGSATVCTGSGSSFFAAVAPNSCNILSTVGKSSVFALI